MNRLKAFFNSPLTLALGVVAILGVTSILYSLTSKTTAANDFRETSVMIVNREMTSGGSGVVLRSENDETQILTNAHVCKVVKNGGMAITTKGNFQVKAYKPSDVSDLCLIYIGSNLGLNTSVATKAPDMYEHSFASGHPALYPNIVSIGHFSGKQVIQVMVDIKQCTEEDMEGPDALYCVFLGGIPVVKSYESVLISSTIMPGSSGSGVFNSRGELVGLVFAGQGGFGYGWTVPHDQLLTFLHKESNTLQKTVISQIILQKSKENDGNKHRAEIKEKCRRNLSLDEKIRDICKIIDRDVIMEDFNPGVR